MVSPSLKPGFDERFNLASPPPPPSAWGLPPRYVKPDRFAHEASTRTDCQADASSIISEYSHDYELAPFQSDGDSTRRLLLSPSHPPSRHGSGGYTPIASSAGEPVRIGRGRGGSRLTNLLRWRPQRPRKGSSYGKPLPETPLNAPNQGSTFHGEFAVVEGGWWQRQMLVDRSLRTMAALTAFFAGAMLAIVFAYLPLFKQRRNPNSTSVGGQIGYDCETVEKQNVVVHLVINIASTLILGMSNTYQQLASALKIDDIRWVLEKKGDSRVGTNSPKAIRDKRTGKLRSLLAWLLLISTSLPIHLLANSLFGLSLYISPPSSLDFIGFDDGHLGYNSFSQQDLYYESSIDLACWTAFRTGIYASSRSLFDMEHSLFAHYEGAYETMNVVYNKTICGQYLKETTDTQVPIEEFNPDYDSYHIGNCTNGSDVYCELDGPQRSSCRLNVRMQAAFILAGCLTIKAIYMIAVNLRSRHQQKTQLLTYGDVIVASSLDPTLQVPNECMVNAGDGYRQRTDHTCHKHCRDPEPSPTGDDIGHCQKCTKYNTHNKAAGLSHASIAIKFKKSLLANLGGTAITQMIILMLCSLAMLAATLMVAVLMAFAASDFKERCLYPDRTDLDCGAGVGQYLATRFGTWGGYNESGDVAILSANSLSSEQQAFWISNGAQLVYSTLYLLLIYNLTLISMEHDWGKLEIERRRLRCTFVRGPSFNQSYILQLPKRILIPSMVFSALMHWLLAQSITTQEITMADSTANLEYSRYKVVFAPYPIFLSTAAMLSMTITCWWAFTYRREGFMPQMYGSIRACCAATTALKSFPTEGIQWGDLGERGKFRHASFSADPVDKIVPGEIYCGDGEIRDPIVASNGDKGGSSACGIDVRGLRPRGARSI